MPPVQHQDTGKVMLNVALPKGRLGDKVYNLLAGIGYGCPEDYNATRKLVVENPAAGIRYFLVKPSDVAIYVEHGAADVGIVGKDILTEAAADVYELLDTGLGRCRMCVAPRRATGTTPAARCGWPPSSSTLQSATTPPWGGISISSS